MHMNHTAIIGTQASSFWFGSDASIVPSYSVGTVFLKSGLRCCGSHDILVKGLLRSKPLNCPLVAVADETLSLYLSSGSVIFPPFTGVYDESSP